MVYSALDALQLARSTARRQIVMLGIGFETTAPTIAAALAQAESERLSNFTVYSMHKLTAPAMRAILDAGEIAVDAVLGPGHVAAITGWEAWSFLAGEYHVSCAVAGFEPTDILQALLACAEDSATGVVRVTNAYGRGVTAAGNLVAQRLMEQVFTTTDAAWRGLGVIPNSGLGIAESYADYDARAALWSARDGRGTSGRRGCVGLPVRRGAPRCDRACGLPAVRQRVHAGASRWTLHGVGGGVVRRALSIPGSDCLMTENVVLMAHGSGGVLSQELIEQVFVRHLSNDVLVGMEDAALVSVPGAERKLTCAHDGLVCRAAAVFPGRRHWQAVGVWHRERPGDARRATSFI